MQQRVFIPYASRNRSIHPGYFHYLHSKVVLDKQTLTERKRESSATRRRSQWPEQSQESTRLQELSYKCSHQLFSCVESFSIVLWAILLWLCDCIHGVDDVFGSTKWWRHSLRRL
ncbi:hypothetical protein PRIC1_007307 [Phytophthora ramorum]